MVAEDTALRPADIAPGGAPLDANRYHQKTTVDIGKILHDMQVGGAGRRKETRAGRETRKSRS